MTSAIESFFAAWGEADGDARATALCATLSDSFFYTDPRAPEPITSQEALTSYVAMYTEYAPGAQARAVVISETKGFFRVTVEFKMADGAVQLGQYFVELDTAGKLTRMIGFVGMGAPE